MEIEEKRYKAMRGIFIAAIAVIVVLSVLLLYDNYKLAKAQTAYSQGWNGCAIECNNRLDIARAQCNQVPVQLPPIEENKTDDGVQIQIIQG
jgi:hypothetical protein